MEDQKFLISFKGDSADGTSNLDDSFGEFYWSIAEYLVSGGVIFSLVLRCSRTTEFFSADLELELQGDSRLDEELFQKLTANLESEPYKKMLKFRKNLPAYKMKEVFILSSLLCLVDARARKSAVCRNALLFCGWIVKNFALLAIVCHNTPPVWEIWLNRVSPALRYVCGSGQTLINYTDFLVFCWLYEILEYFAKSDCFQCRLAKMGPCTSNNKVFKLLQQNAIQNRCGVLPRPRLIRSVYKFMLGL